MTPDQFDAWAYKAVRDYLEGLAPTTLERSGVERVKAFVAGLEGDREVLVK